MIVCTVAGLSDEAMIAAYEKESSWRVEPDDFLVVFSPAEGCDRFRGAEESPDPPGAPHVCA